MDEMAIAGMIFSLLCLLIIGGFILLYPLSRRLGDFLEQRIHERRAGVGVDGASEADLAELRRALRSLEQEVSTLAERQRFVEGLLDAPERTRTLSTGEEV